MEDTFSRNHFIANRVEGADHGLWGGYSFESDIEGNEFLDNRVGIAIEHGQDNRIARNSFDGGTTAIRLWADSIEPSDWGYPRHRDTRGRGYEIVGNSFTGNRVGLRAKDHTSLTLARKTLTDVDTASIPEGLLEHHAAQDPGTPLPAHTGKGRSAIIVDSWGPYDWRSPKLWPAGHPDSLPIRLVVLGPDGSWSVRERDGVARLSDSAGVVGDTVVLVPRPGREHDWQVELESRGEAVTSPRGLRTAAGQPYRFATSACALEPVRPARSGC